MYLVRHGETEWNVAGRLQGRQDSALTQKGTEQAQAMGRLLSQHFIDTTPVLMASPLGRTWATAGFIASALTMPEQEMIADPTLMEISWGEWEGQNRAEIAASWPALWADRQRDKWSTRPPGGESYADLADRLRPWLAAHHNRAELVVVSHGAVARMLRGLYLELDPKDIADLDEPQDACFEFTEGRILRHNVDGSILNQST